MMSPLIYKECILPILAYADFLVESVPKVAQACKKNEVRIS